MDLIPLHIMSVTKQGRGPDARPLTAGSCLRAEVCPLLPETSLCDVFCFVV